MQACSGLSAWRFDSFSRLVRSALASSSWCIQAGYPSIYSTPRTTVVIHLRCLLEPLLASDRFLSLPSLGTPWRRIVPGPTSSIRKLTTSDYMHRWRSQNIVNRHVTWCPRCCRYSRLVGRFRPISLSTLAWNSLKRIVLGPSSSVRKPTTSDYSHRWRSEYCEPTCDLVSMLSWVSTVTRSALAGPLGYHTRDIKNEQQHGSQNRLRSRSVAGS